MERKHLDALDVAEPRGERRDRLDLARMVGLTADEDMLGIPFPLASTPTPSPELTAAVRERFAGAGLG